MSGRTNQLMCSHRISIKFSSVREASAVTVSAMRSHRETLDFGKSLSHVRSSLRFAPISAVLFVGCKREKT
jgi:hypothetical protein